MSIYNKGWRVVKSCNNLEQVFVARKWLDLMAKEIAVNSREFMNSPVEDWQKIHAMRELRSLLNERRDEIYSELVN